MSIIGNIIWLLFGGLIVALEYFIAGFLLLITIVGIPFGLQSFKLGILALWPFSSRVVPTQNVGGCLNTIFNVIWIIFFGIWIALTHLVFGALLCITIIGIPFGLQHFKLAGFALSPFGHTVN
ncbi:MAG: YccF domain-containing protein [Bacteroidales bacterium]|nr:YccF domain-containing protein [Bacteroidales bacterium]